MKVQDYLPEQRQKCSFNVQKMTEFLYPQPLLKDLKLAFQKNQPLESDFNVFNKGRVSILKGSYSKVPLLLNDKDFQKQANIIDAIYNSIQQMPGSIHLSMFLKCIQIMGSEQQKKQFIEAGWKYEIIGCYAQTEIGHGSDIQSLQTTATFIQQTGQIQIHTPSVSAAKYWPGDLGVMANYALVFAQLSIKGKKHGVHPFIVRIRDQNWQCMPGVTAGDIGPKMSFQAKQNGFLLLNRIRVSRNSILAKFLQITASGQLKRTGDPKISYATMMFIRQFISTAYPKVYGQAISIAIRYSIFRRQFRNKGGHQIAIINYQTQQQKLIPRIAEYFALAVGGNVIRKLCLENSQRVERNHDLSLIGQTHACLCLGKALYSEIVYDGMEVCRKACGGHGFSQYSGIVNIINQYAPNLTHEGQNTVLYLQIARYMLKNYKAHMMQSGKMNQNALYIASYDYFMEQKTPEYLAEQPLSWRLQDIRKILAQTVCCLVSKTTDKIMSKPQDLSDIQFMGYFAGCNLQHLGKAHGIYFTFVHFLQAIMRQTHEQVKIVTTDLCKLFGITWFLQLGSPVIQNNLITRQHINSLNQCKEHLLANLRPNVMGLVDSFFIPDSRLRTHLGKGNPYENYLQMARKCQINDKISESAFVVKGINKSLALHSNHAKL